MPLIHLGWKNAFLNPFIFVVWGTQKWKEVRYWSKCQAFQQYSQFFLMGFFQMITPCKCHIINYISICFGVFFKLIWSVYLGAWCSVKVYSWLKLGKPFQYGIRLTFPLCEHIPPSSGLNIHTYIIQKKHAIIYLVLPKHYDGALSCVQWPLLQSLHKLQIMLLLHRSIVFATYPTHNS